MIRPVKLPDDLIEINNWMRARGHKNLDLDFVPPQGFIFPGVAAGFMITTNTCVGILEHFTSNMHAREEERAKALDLIAEKLISAGKSSGLRMFLAMTKHPNILGLCKKHEFSELHGLRVFGRN